MNVSEMRHLLREAIAELKNTVSHGDIPSICVRLGLAGPPVDGSKRERLLAAFDATADDALAEVARRYLAQFPPNASLRIKIEDLLWASSPRPAMSLRHRRDIARALEGGPLFTRQEGFHALLSRLWVLDDDPFGGFLGPSGQSLREQIERHVYRNPDDWTVEQLFDRLGALNCGHDRFARLLEGLASQQVRPDEEEQRAFVQRVNSAVEAAGVALRETGSDGGYPTFTLVQLRGAPSKAPKNIIFASSVKPDLRFRDAVSNDIEIVSNADRVLVYDRTITAEGLRWADLQTWWAARQGIIDDDSAKRTLYQRLRESLPPSSPPQTRLFESFFRTFRAHIPRLPALLPEVWLHWDPKTAEERGLDALARFRMDFLLLLRHGIRVVVEVDGRHHFANEDGRASPEKYGAMMAADRDLRLAGYEVYRFGAAELDRSEAARERVKVFFEALFRRHGVLPL